MGPFDPAGVPPSSYNIGPGPRGDFALAIRRKLNIQQLVTLSEVYWDDAAKLAEILEELRSRLEPEAEALFRTVSGRIHLLKTNPAAAREQPPPTQQALAEEA